MNTEPLHIIVGARRSGKTERMLELLRGTPSGLIVVRTATEARHIADRGYGRAVVTMDEIRRGSLQGRNVRLLVDNADSLLRSVLGPHEIVAATFTGEGEILPATTQEGNRG